MKKSLDQIIQSFILKIKEIRYFLVKKIYANTNDTSHIRSVINKLLKQYSEKSFILNIGSGNKRIAPHIKNLDIFKGEYIDYVCDAAKIPLENNSVDLIITQEAFEHIAKYNKALNECYRILKDEGKMYFQVPFIVGYHPGPTDFCRFTKEGIENLLSKKGFFIFEEPYLGDVIRLTSYDQIYDEHVYLFSLLSVDKIAKLFDLEIIDAYPQTTHGGSMRYVLARKGEYVISDNFKKLLLKELEQGLDKFETYLNFKEDCENSKKRLIQIH